MKTFYVFQHTSPILRQKCDIMSHKLFYVPLLPYSETRRYPSFPLKTGELAACANYDLFHMFTDYSIKTIQIHIQTKSSSLYILHPGITARMVHLREYKFNVPINTNNSLQLLNHYIDFKYYETVYLGIIKLLQAIFFVCFMDFYQVATIDR